MTQKDKVLLYLRQHQFAGVRQIMNDCYINSPTKVISDLRRDGHKIADEQRTTETGAKYKVYKLESEPAQGRLF